MQRAVVTLEGDGLVVKVVCSYGNKRVYKQKKRPIRNHGDTESCTASTDIANIVLFSINCSEYMVQFECSWMQLFDQSLFTNNIKTVLTIPGTDTPSALDWMVS